MTGSGRHRPSRPPTASGGSKQDPRVSHLGSTGAYDRPTQPATGVRPLLGDLPQPPQASTDVTVTTTPTRRAGAEPR